MSSDLEKCSVPLQITDPASAWQKNFATDNYIKLCKKSRAKQILSVSYHISVSLNNILSFTL